MGKTIVISNQRGGFIKLITSTSLGFGFVRQSKRVLNLDADLQHSLNVSFGITREVFNIA